jgi:hypothetical protein
MHSSQQLEKGRGMVGNLLAALGVAAGLHAGEPADVRQYDEIDKLSQAIALTRACPYLKVDKTRVAVTLAKAGIRIAPLMPEIGRRADAMALNYLHMNRKDACQLARGLYGAAGTSAPGFLAER